MDQLAPVCDAQKRHEIPHDVRTRKTFSFLGVTTDLKLQQVLTSTRRFLSD